MVDDWGRLERFPGRTTDSNMLAANVACSGGVLGGLLVCMVAWAGYEALLLWGFAHSGWRFG